jgi:hypothetical protein
MKLNIKLKTKKKGNNKMNTINQQIINYKNLVISKYEEYMKRNNFTEINACDFEIKEGKKYFKIIKRNKVGTSASVHSFVNKENGDIYKVASANVPAKHSRGNIFNNNGADALSCYHVKYLR